MFFSDAVIIMPFPSSSVSIIVVGGEGWSLKGVWAWSKGIVRTERGHLPWTFLRGLGGANLMGEREGSFSLLAVEVLFSSFSFSASEDVIISSWSVVGAGKGCVGCGCGVLPFLFIVTDCTFVPFRERSARESSCCS